MLHRGHSIHTIRVLSGVSERCGCGTRSGYRVKEVKKRDEEVGIKVMTRARTSLQLLLDTSLMLEISRNTFDQSTNLFTGTFSIERFEPTEAKTKDVPANDENDGGVGYTYVCDLHRG